jgi:hypothetical protein
MAERIAARHRQTAFTGILAARLFADAEYHGEVGIHYAGPTWESHSGGKVIASRLEGCTPRSDRHSLVAAPDRLFQNSLGRSFSPGIAVDALQCFPANCLYGGRNRLQVCSLILVRPQAL